MKNKHSMMLLLPSCYLMVCVDSKHDLSDVDTDGAVVGESQVAPLGVSYVTSGDVVSVEKVPSARKVDGAYVMIYDGETRIRGKSLQATPDKVEIVSEDITTEDIDDLFNGDFALALTNPHITLGSNVKNASLDYSLSIGAENTSKKGATSSDFTLSTASPNTWVGPLDPKTDVFKFIKSEKLPGTAQIVPQKIHLSLPADSKRWMNTPANVLNELRYAVELPSTPAPGFSAVSAKRIEGAFDGDFVNHIFSDGSVRTYGEVTNEVPFDMFIEIVIMDENNISIDIQFPAQEIKRQSGGAILEITKEDMPKMRDARYIDLNSHLTGRD